MKHGPLALVDDKMPILVIATNDCMYNKMSSVIAQLHARKAQLIVLCNSSSSTQSLRKYCRKLIEVRPIAVHQHPAAPYCTTFHHPYIALLLARMRDISAKASEIRLSSDH